MGITAVGIDISLTRTGIAIVRDNRYSVAQVASKLKDFEAPEERIKYIATSIVKAVKKMAIAFNVELTDLYWGLEDYALNSRSGKIFERVELAGLVKQLLWSKTGRLPFKVPPQTLKKFITGKGKGVEKNVMLLSVYTKYDIQFENDDVADAFSVAKVVDACFLDSSKLYKYEQEVVKVVKERSGYTTKRL